MKRLWILALLLGLALTLPPASAQDDTDDGSSLDAMPAGATPVPLPTRMPRPAPASRVDGERASLDVFFDRLPQGSTGLLRVAGQAVAGARARFLDQLTDFFPIPNDGFYGLLSVDMEKPPGRYPLAIFVSYADGTREPINTEVVVTDAGFWSQEVTIEQDKANLLSPDVERNELARLESIFSRITLQRFWDETGFQLPILSSLTSPFGAFRTFNGTLNTRHTGWDIRTTLGTPVMAAAAGQVVYAGRMDIRGNYVFIDHGFGVYSGYAHLAQIHVTRGQQIAKGQVIGVVGDTGRTSGPHFHWEMAVNGEWVDSVQFIEMWMP